ncbi:MAG: sialate O-acetylesterase [Verrucomicrobiota bacterium]
MKTPALLIAFAASCLHAAAHQEVVIPSVFSDHMVLQRDMEVPVWGISEPGESISVTFGGQTKTVSADEAGKWKALLDAMPASAKGRTLTVKGSNEITVKDVLVGEVWICSGQSNMAWTVSKTDNAEEEIANGDFPQIRQYKAMQATARRPQSDVEGEWFVASPETVGNFTATGFYFGRELHEKLDIPIGLINTSWGGTRAEAWTSAGGLKKNPKADPILNEWKDASFNYDPKSDQERYETALENWKVRVAKAREAGQGPPFPRRPRTPGHPRDSQHCPSALYNGMLHPLIPYGIRGAIWYQGESNRERAKQYRAIFPGMIRDWRAKWKQGAFPFYFVQLANFQQPATEPGTDNSWAELQEAQALTLQALPKTGMATINDIGAADDIHPRNKQDVGRRLARWALVRDYGQKGMMISGPIYKDYAVEDDRIRVHFDYAGNKLKTRDNQPLKWFEIAGEDKVWHWADAEIDGATVVVSSPDVPSPVAVRYAWTANPEGANLVNRDGLPTSLFRTDDWERVTKGNVLPGVN